MFFSLTLVDVNPNVVHAWREAFADVPDVAVVHGSILQQDADAWVTPTNAKASMSGGVDAVMSRYFGGRIESRVKREVVAHHGGRLTVGHAVCTATDGLPTPPAGHQPRYLISTATMGATAQDVSRSDNAAWAFAAAIQAACQRNANEGGVERNGVIRTLAVPGLGTATGRIPPTAAAWQMRSAWEIFRDEDGGYDSFEDMHEALLAQLELGPMAVAAAAKPRRKRVLGIF